MSNCKQFVCEECGQGYDYKKNLRQHVRTKHPGKVDDVSFSGNKKKNCEFKCNSCDKKFSHFRNLSFHERKYHTNLQPHELAKNPGKIDDVASNRKKNFEFKCKSCDRQYNLFRNLRYHERKFHSAEIVSTNSFKCSLCEFRPNTKRSFLDHLETEHSAGVKSQDLEFSCFEDFVKWKQNVEKETFSRYVKERGSKRCADNSTRHYFVCHRSGYYMCQSTGQRHLKTQGSNKINGTCPASIRVIESEGGMCKISYISTHVGHQNDIGHLNLSDSERCDLATDLANKIPFHAILDKIRDSVSDSKLERIHLLTRKDLYNIEQCYNLCADSVRHRDDGTSVEAWVNEVRASDKSCVLFYKPQNTVTELHPELKNDDFVLIIMNNAQCDLLKKYGSDCICIDGTHGLNNYGFELITLLVLDDMRQGFPCAFLISNRTDQHVLSIFFEYIKNEAGIICPKVFMSDMADSFFNAWVLTMEPPTVRLYCSWHVDRAWRKNLSKVNGREKQAEVYKLLRTLLQERDPAAFEMMLPAVINRLNRDSDTADFGAYFSENYVKNFQSWAYCFRLNSGINTNMHIERMHRTLKYIYLQGKTGRRLDKAIFAIMNFLRDKLFDRLIVLTKGKVTSKLVNIRSRHRASLLLNMDWIIEEDNGWKVSSTSEVKELYHVKENRLDCPCKLVCTECATCIHKYTCTCVDSTIKWNMCKHIHLICQKKKKHEITASENFQASASTSDGNLCIHLENELEFTEKEDIVAELNKTKCSTFFNISGEQVKLEEDMHEIIKGISTQSEVEVIRRYTVAIKATLAAVRSQNGCLSNSRQAVPGREQLKRNIVPQRRLFSTKRRKVSHRAGIVKPNETEIQDIAISLLHNN